MTFRDLIAISAGNLTRMKLRTTLTVAGVVVAIGTFVAMLSFGAGNQRYVTEQFEALGLFHTMQVYPLDKGAKTEERPAILDSAALSRLAELPGVRLAYPFDAFACTVTLGDSQVTSQAQALSQSALQMPWFSRLSAGSTMTSDSAHEAIVTTRLLDKFGIKADSVIGRKIVLQVRVSNVDSGLAHVLPFDRTYIRQRIKDLNFDSLLNREYAAKLVRTELNSAMSRFLDGFLNNRALVAETLTVTGVIAANGPRERNMTPVMVPIATARNMTSGLVLDDPTALMGALQSGKLMLGTNGSGNAKTYGHITLDLDPSANQTILADSIKALGYRPFSFAEQFKEIQKAFFYFDLALGVIGIIALVTASLGIINTLVMSVLERRKEIGVLKALGADEGDIRLLFVVESGVIGFLGSVLGILLGWLISRLASYIGQVYMAREGIEGIDLFALPLWLIAAAIAVGLAGSLLAGMYPAARAARVDPVEALRND